MEKICQIFVFFKKKKKKNSIYILNCSKKNNVIIRVSLDTTYFIEIKN